MEGSHCEHPKGCVPSRRSAPSKHLASKSFGAGVAISPKKTRLLRFTPAAESHGLWPWMNAPALGRDVAPLGRSLGATGFARGAPLAMTIF